MTGELRGAVGVPNVGVFGDPLLLVELATAAEEHGAGVGDRGSRSGAAAGGRPGRRAVMQDTREHRTADGPFDVILEGRTDGAAPGRGAGQLARTWRPG